MSGKIWDWVIIGAGLGGLISAGLLKSRFPDRSVVILESHTDIGGCAGCFERSVELAGYDSKQRVRFDVGATTLSALGEGQSLRRVLNELGIELPASLADPGLRVVMRNGSIVHRHANADEWYRESTRHFGERSIELWRVLSSIEQDSWKLLRHFPTFPPASFSDAFALIRPQALIGITALRNTARPFANLLQDLHLEDNKPLIEFIDQLLLVSTQTSSRSVSVIGAALGLIYPSQTYYVDGGAYALSAELLKRYLSLGGEMRFKQRVEHVNVGKNFELSTTRGDIFQARQVISNATLWDTREMLDRDRAASKYFHKWDAVRTGDDVWGANAYYAIVGDEVGGSAIFHQLHTDDGGSIFVSLSRIGDSLKAPSGYRTLTASTHETDPDRWFRMTRSDYEIEKKRLRARFERILRTSLEGFGEHAPQFDLVGTPLTFEFYTRRRSGLVGGLAYKAGRMPWHWPSPVSPVEGLFLVGDTIFPGQSAGAVAHCATSLISRFS
ncbi:MAG TPA: NAD(P)/FAD-dependent oxidoreductase [Candidatus Kapabacteria bacterium]|nr:NAD(P)/FAD-dependent oxidoreductase [Candidatus Kapabacteria bacterium]